MLPGVDVSTLEGPSSVELRLSDAATIETSVLLMSLSEFKVTAASEGYRLPLLFLDEASGSLKIVVLILFMAGWSGGEAG